MGLGGTAAKMGRERGWAAYTARAVPKAVGAGGPPNTSIFLGRRMGQSFTEPQVAPPVHPGTPQKSRANYTRTAKNEHPSPTHTHTHKVCFLWHLN